MSNVPTFLKPSPIPSHAFPVSQVAAHSEATLVMHDEKIQGQQLLQADINENDLINSTENTTYCMKQQKNKKQKNKDGEGSSSILLNTKKTRFLWTPNKHKNFVAAVESLGCERAVPTKIMEVMGVEGLTRHIVASHLQKYRAQLKKMNERAQVSPLPPFRGVVQEPVSGLCCSPANMFNIPTFLNPSPIPPNAFPVSQVAAHSEAMLVMHDEMQGQQFLQADINKNDLMYSTENNAYCTMQQKNKKRKNEDGEGSSGIQLNTKKTRFLWTPNKQKNFVAAVESLGHERAVPTKIMALMGVEGLTRHIVASHLQKYRTQLRSGNQKEQAQDELYDLHDFAPMLQQMPPEDLAFIDDDLPTRAMPHVEEPLPPLVDIIGSVYEGLDEFPWGNSQDMMGLAANIPKNAEEKDADVVDQFFNFSEYLVDQKIKEIEEFLFDDEACQLE